jgi:hypothetical protein
LYGWYEGHSKSNKIPSQNNALEASNRVIKDESTFRERLSFNEFIHLVMQELLPDWSTGRNPDSNNNKAWADEVEIDLPTWTRAYQWLQLKKDIVNSRSTKI